MSLKAYMVHCHDDDHGAKIVFAERSKDVDRRCNSEVCDCDFVDRKVHRAPKFDDLAGRELTVLDYLKRGWHWECSFCSHPLTINDDPIIVADKRIYCDRECIEKSHRDYGEIVATGRAHESIVDAWTLVDQWLRQHPVEPIPAADAEGGV